MDFLKVPGLLIVVGSLVIFYLRLMQLRGRKRKLEHKAAVARMNEANRKRGNVSKAPAKNPNNPPYAVSNWFLVVIAVLLMLLGVAIRSRIDFLPLIESYWWIPTTLGVLVFTFCFKVEV